ncbi:MAG: hypothetical protein GTO40_02165 [Deltaproteobacteria bacterium]|nr:hypothetical protein [Deltaproteobacteria bacterium]
MKDSILGSIPSLLCALFVFHGALETSAKGATQGDLGFNVTDGQWLEARRPERIDKMHMPPPPQAVLEFHHVKFNPRWAKLEMGAPIGIYVSFKNTGPPGSVTSDFRIYLSRNGQLLQKGHPSSNKLRAGRASFTNFQITLPNVPVRHCWEVSLRQTDEGRMTLGGPKEICALLKGKLAPAPLQRQR